MARCRLNVGWWMLCAATLGPVLLAPSLALATESEKPTPEQVEFFEKKIRPVLVAKCYECHSAESEELKGGLLLDSREASRKGGESGPAIVPGDPDGSLLVQALRYESFEMPPTGKLPANVVADFEEWVKLGAHDPRDGPSVPAAPSKAIDFEAGRQFWSFQPPQPHALPPTSDPAWPRQKIDGFIAARREAAGLDPAQPADRRTWIRRVSFDLTGLLPSPTDVERYVADKSPDADARLVDRLLATPQYGERVARMWLDLARYAEDQAHIVGKDESLFYPNAYLYRDWIITALNRDLPYDEFVKLQLAADLFEGDDSPNLPALGLLGLGPKYYSRRSLQVMSDEWEDRVDVVSRGLLGLTVACARCHDHKFDPIGTEDYYALAGVFASTQMFNRPLRDGVELKDNKKDDDDKEFENGKKVPGEAKDPKDAMHIVREGESQDLPIFIRGNVENKGPVASRHFLRVLCEGEPPSFASVSASGSGRRELAEAIVSPENPLTARVIVNRVWGLYFGRPLVATASNFGAQGEEPTHPELLDDLAVRFVDNGWSLKWLTRELVLSATYRQSSSAECGIRNAELQQGSSASIPHSALRIPHSVDPENRLLSHMPRRRLSIEQWRDAVLAVAGRLESSVGGPSIDPQDPAEGRRTIYSRASRLELNRLLAMFDYPDPNVHADKRVETTTPLQKLFVLNSPFMVEQAAALAERLQTEVSAGESPEAADRERIERAYALAYARPPSDEELRLGLAFLAAGDDHAARWRQYAHVLLAANELLYVD